MTPVTDDGRLSNEKEASKMDWDRRDFPCVSVGHRTLAFRV